MGGSYAPPALGGTLAMPIPLLHVNGVPGATFGDAPNRTVSAFNGDLSSIFWNQTATDFRSASLALAVGPSVSNDTNNKTYLRCLKNGTATETYLNTIGGVGSRFDLAIGGAVFLQAEWPTTAPQKISIFKPLEATQGLKTTQVNTLDFISPLNLLAGNSQIARLFPFGGVFFGNAPVDPGVNNVRIANGLKLNAGTLLTQLIGKSFVAENPIGSGDFTIAAGASLDFTILTNGSYTEGAVIASWKGSSPSLGELRLHARVSGLAQITLRITNESATGTILSGSASFPITLCVLGFNYVG